MKNFFSLFVLFVFAGSSSNASTAGCFPAPFSSIPVEHPPSIQEKSLAPYAAMSLSTTNTNVSCNGKSDGTASVLVTGGTSPFTYFWSPSGGSNATATGLAAGTYTVTVTDASHTTASQDVVITEPAAMAGTVTTTNVTCNGSSNGMITIANVNGGGGTYQYSYDFGGSWQGSGTTFIVTNLSVGSYNIQVRDAAVNSCTVVLKNAATITQPVPLSATLKSINVSGCYGNSNGAISFTNAAGGSGSFQYSINGGTNWGGSGTSYNMPGLPAGTYNVKIRDANYSTCILTLNTALTITQPVVLNAAMNSTNVSGCYGNSNGSIAITDASGGSGIYQYSSDGGANWTGSGTSYTFGQLGAGTYNVKIRDAAVPACTLTLNNALTITQPAQLAFHIERTNVTDCYESANGTITIAGAVGGSGNYEYSIDAGNTWQSSSSFTEIKEGTYHVSLRDQLNPSCTSSPFGDIGISGPDSIAIWINASPACTGSSNGSATATVHGGTGSLSYTWAPSGGTDLTTSGVAAGKYFLTVTDANKCLREDSIEVEETTCTEVSLSTGSSQLSIYPNPAKDVAYLSSRKTADMIYLYNAQGKEVLQAQQTSEIRVAGTTPGMYTVKIVQGTSVVIQKLLIE